MAFKEVYWWAMWEGQGMWLDFHYVSGGPESFNSVLQKLLEVGGKPKKTLDFVENKVQVWDDCDLWVRIDPKSRKVLGWRLQRTR